MHNIVFDEESNGFKIIPFEPRQDIFTLRPVFYEELDLLGFDKFWSYPRCEEPLLWCNIINRTYYFRGFKVAKVLGGGFFSKPDLEIYEKNLKLEPVNLHKLVEDNRSILNVAINAVLDLVVDVFEKSKGWTAVVGFSGGKDSTVLLDLVQRVLLPHEFSVIFNDTSMELKATLRFVSEIKSRYENLKFIVSKHEKSATLTWREFGPPSRIQRWCCTVHKMVPSVKTLKEIFGHEAKILFFDGIRADESSKRKGLDFLSHGKYLRQKNVHPILNWSIEMVWLYTFMRGLPINEAYRYGVSRVGCIVCPFESEWWETIIWSNYREEAEPYIEILRDYTRLRGIRDSEQFIREGNWKVRTDGKGWQKSRIHVSKKNQEIEISFKQEEGFKSWAKVLRATYSDGSMNLRFKERDYSIKIKSDGHTTILIPEREREICSIVKKLALKSVYCVKCGYCEIICPRNAVTLNAKVKILEHCTGCLECVSKISRGCLVADSLKISTGGFDEMGLGRSVSYKHFGIRKLWLQEFFKAPENWLKGENSCGPVQFEAMKKWLIDAEFIAKEKRGYRVTEISNLLSPLGVDSPFVWGVLWVNLAKNSSLVSWYVFELQWGKYYSREQILELMGSNLSFATRKNALQSLIEIFKHTPLGSEFGLGVLDERKSKAIGIEKVGVKEERINSDFLAVVLYSLYKLKESVGGNYLSLQRLYDDRVLSPAHLFGLESQLLRKILRSLQESFSKSIIAVDLAADIDNIVLSSDLSVTEVIKLYLQKGV